MAREIMVTRFNQGFSIPWNVGMENPWFNQGVLNTPWFNGPPTTRGAVLGLEFRLSKEGFPEPPANFFFVDFGMEH